MWVESFGEQTSLTGNANIDHGVTINFVTKFNSLDEEIRIMDAFGNPQKHLGPDVQK